jgi:hypothetical protein
MGAISTQDRLSSSELLTQIARVARLFGRVIGDASPASGDPGSRTAAPWEL